MPELFFRKLLGREALHQKAFQLVLRSVEVVGRSFLDNSERCVERALGGRLGASVDDGLKSLLLLRRELNGHRIVPRSRQIEVAPTNPHFTIPDMRSTVTSMKELSIPMNHLKSLIREVPDSPKPGINLYNITTLPKEARGLHLLIGELGAAYAGRGIDKIVGIEARGYILAPAVTYALNAGFVPMHKPGELPSRN